MKFGKINTLEIISNNLSKKTVKKKHFIFCFIINSSIFVLLFIFLIIILLPLACGSKGNGDGDDGQPIKIELPDSPIDRAAVSGLITSYRESTMWQIKDVKVINMTPMVPSTELLEIQDPKEVYCVCLQYQARYKVTWSTSQGSPWEDTIRNILVIKDQGDQYYAVKPMNVCSPFCG
jgi:hypothetical protein